MDTYIMDTCMVNTCVMDIGYMQGGKCCVSSVHRKARAFYEKIVAIDTPFERLSQGFQ